MVNDSGSGFMGKEWDSIKKEHVLSILCHSKRFARFVIEFFMSLQVVPNSTGESIVPGNANMRQNIETQNKKNNTNAPYVEPNSPAKYLVKKVNINSAHVVVLTKGEVLDLCKGLYEPPTSVIEKLPENVLFVIPLLYIINLLKNIVPANVLKFPTEIECSEKITPLLLTDVANINGVIAGMIGKPLENNVINEIIGNASIAENIVSPMKYNATTLSLGNIINETHWIFWLLFVIDVTRKSNYVPRYCSKKDLTYALIREFHQNWATETIRVMKPGAFGFVMSSPRQDVLDVMLQGLRDAGFVICFTSLIYTFASGFPKAANASKLADKHLGAERVKVRVPANEVRNPKSINGGVGVEGGTRPFIEEARRVGYHEIDGEQPITDAATRLQGAFLGFQPKPAVEIIVVCMKPLSAASYIAQAVRDSKGVTWLDDGRIPAGTREVTPPACETRGVFAPAKTRLGGIWNTQYTKDNVTPVVDVTEKGRFPANLLVSDGVLDGAGCADHKAGNNNSDTHPNRGDIFPFAGGTSLRDYHGFVEKFSDYFSLDRWWAAFAGKLPKEVRDTFPFLVTPKPTKGEKEKGLDRFTTKKRPVLTGATRPVSQNPATNDGNRQNQSTETKNFHPTCKPIQLFTWLLTIGSRPGDLVLDPFAGSGTTGVAAEVTRRNALLVEMNPEYVELIKGRLKGNQLPRDLGAYF
jgi:site-specific DNA-methyltransferase (adenine-specific)